MPSQTKHKLLALTLASCAGLSVSGQTYALPGFTGAYDFNNFTLTNSIPNNGSVVTTDAAIGTVVLIGGNDDSMTGSTTDWTITVISNGVGTVSFDWKYSSLDTPGDDSAGFLVNTLFTVLATADHQASTLPVTFNVVEDDVVGLRVQTLQNIGGAGEFTVSNFTFVPVPFEFSPALGLVGLGAMGILQKIRKAAKHKS